MVLRFRRLVAAAAVAVAAGAALPSSADATATAVPACSDAIDAAIRFDFPVGTTTATGHYALPAGEPAGIVAFFHGYGHTSTSWREHLARTARDLGVIAVAMDYRGTVVTSTDANGIQSARGWRVQEGAEETNAVVRAIASQCPAAASGPVTAFGVSMGGNASGLAVAAGHQRPDGSPLYDWWFDIEGATDAVETYLSARSLGLAVALAKPAQEDIEAEVGGCAIEACPDRYRDLVVFTRAPQMRAAGLKGAVLVHGTDDGLVPPSHTRKMIGALHAARIPFSAYQVVTRGDGEAGTTITGYAAPRVVPDYQSPLAGHASERSTTHLVMRTSFTRLSALYAGDAPTGFDEHVVDGSTGTSI